MTDNERAANAAANGNTNGDTNGDAIDVIVGVTGVVLAGGRSSRMGADKAALLIGGEPLLRRVVRRLRLALAETLVVGPPELAPLLQPMSSGQAPMEGMAGQKSAQEAQRIAATRILPDAQPGLGPLGGLETALDAITTPYAFVIACDMPFVQPALVRAQARLALTTTPTYGAVALRTAHGLEPLHAVYARACLPIVHEQLAAGDLAMWRLLARLRVRELTADEVALADPNNVSTRNANTPDEWARALALADEAI